MMRTHDRFVLCARRPYASPIGPIRVRTDQLEIEQRSMIQHSNVSISTMAPAFTAFPSEQQPDSTRLSDPVRLAPTKNTATKATTEHPHRLPARPYCSV